MFRILLGLLLAGCMQASEAPALRSPEVRFEPSPPEVVEAMLALGRVGPGDVVFDLGCGDGRIVIAAARRGARGVCVDIDPRRIAEARGNARAAGIAERIAFLNQDLFATDLAPATVVTLFLSLDLNIRLRPKLLRELKPGTRVVSHWHGMGDWTPEKSLDVKSAYRYHPVYLWTVLH
jgi:ribosomal protein L11 methylase PrmA